MSEVSWRSGENRWLPSSSPQRGVAEPTVKPESSLIRWVAGGFRRKGEGDRFEDHGNRTEKA